MSTCARSGLPENALRDYAFDELPAEVRPVFERHLSECGSCSAELDQLRLTTAALRVLPDQEPPQRIAFVSDKVFAPSRFLSFAPWLGFASAAVMAAALIITVYHRPVEIRTVAVQQPAAASPVQPVDDIVNKAVAQAREEDARMLKTALDASEAKHDREHRILMDAVAVMQQSMNTGALLSSVRDTQTGVGQ